MSDVCRDNHGHQRAQQQIFCNSVFAFIVIKIHYSWSINRHYISRNVEP
jgi:hypothetical protein